MTAILLTVDATFAQTPSPWLNADGLAKATPVGSEFQVNTYTTGGQYNTSVAMEPDGGFVVTWTSFGSGGTDATYGSIQGQRFASNGTTLGAQFQVNTYTTNYQRRPSVAMGSAGDFVVVWTSNGSGGTDLSSNSIQGQRFASNGAITGAQFQVNTYTTSHQGRPSVAMGSDGGFVVVWTSFGSGGTDLSSNSIQGQRFASNGATVDGQFQVSTYITSYQVSPSVAMGSDGDFVVVWISYGSASTDSSSSSIQGQRFASNGATVGGEFQVNTYTTNSQGSPSVATGSDGDFVVVWTSAGSGGTDLSISSIQSQRFASNGTAIGDQFQVNSYTTGLQTGSSVAAHASGEFVVVWESFGSASTDSSSSSIQGQHFASSGAPVGGEFQVNTYTTNNQYRPSISVAANGSVLVAWSSRGSSGTDSSNSSIQGQRFVKSADLSIAKSDSADPVDAGATLTYTLDVNNAGPDTATSIEVVDTLPTGTGFVSASGTGWSCRDGAGQVICTRSSLEVGAAPPIILTVTARPEGGNMFNNVTVSAAEFDPSAANNSASETTFVTPIADLSVTKSDSPDPVNAGETLTYTLNVANAGPSTATFVNLVDTLPPEVEFIRATGEPWICSEEDGTVSCVHVPPCPDFCQPYLEVGAAPPITITVSAPPQGGIITNNVTVNATEEDPIPGNDSASQTTTVTPVADLAIVKTDSVDPVIPGTEFSYTLTLTNNGPSDASGGIVDDVLPAGLSLVSFPPQCLGPPPPPPGEPPPPDALNCPLDPIAVGESHELTFVVAVDPDLISQISNTAEVDGNENDPVSANDSFTETTSVAPEADLAIVKTDSMDPVIPGTEFSYTLTVTNNGPSDASGGIVDDVLPAGLSLISFPPQCLGPPPPPPGEPPPPDALNCPVDPIAVGESHDLTFVVAVDPDLISQISNTAEVDGNEDDPNPANDSDSETTEVAPEADLSISKTNGVILAMPGESTIYTVTATNHGPSDVPSVRVRDTFPPVLSCAWTSEASGGATGHSSSSGSTLNDDLAMPADSSVIYTIECDIDPGATGTLTNMATISSVTDVTPDNNSATDTDQLEVNADLGIVVDDGVASAIPGGQLSYTITAINQGPADATQVSVDDDFPPALSCSWTSTATGDASGHSQGAGQLSDTLDMPRGSSVVYLATCDVDPTALGTLSNTATISSSVTDPLPGNNVSTDGNTVLMPEADLRLTKLGEPDEAVGGESLTYRVEAFNEGPSQTLATIVDDFPAGLAGCAWTSVASGGAFGNSDGAGENLNDSLTLPPGSSVEYTIGCDIEVDVSGILRNTAEITTEPGVLDTAPQNNADTIATEVTGIADLAITFAETAPATAVPGTALTGVSLTVSNDGPLDVAGAAVVVPTPLALDDVSWTCVPSAGAACAAGPRPGDLNSVVDLAVGASASYTLTAEVRAAATGTATLAGTILSPLSDPEPLDNSDALAIVLEPETDLSISLDDEGREEAIAGKRLRYFVTIENAGPSHAPATRLTTSFPLTDLNWVCTTSGGQFCGLGAGSLEETIDLAVNDGRRYRVVAEVPELASGELRSTAEIGSLGLKVDPDLGNNSAEDVNELVSGEVDDLDGSILLEARNPDITVTADGQAVVVFEREEEDGSIQIYRQVLDTSAQPVPGGLDQLTDLPLGANEPAIATFRAGPDDTLRHPEEDEDKIEKDLSDDTVEVWTEVATLDIRGRTAGLASFQVSALSAPEDRRPDVASLFAGAPQALAVWQRATPGQPIGVVGRRIDELGAFGAEIQIVSQGSQASVAARANQQYLVVWRAGGKIRGRRLNRDGQMVGGEVLFSTAADGNQDPQVAYYADPCGTQSCGDRFLVVWRRQAEIFGRLYDKNLIVQTAPFPITTLCPDEVSSLTGNEGGLFTLTVVSTQFTNATRHKTIDPTDGSVAGEVGPCKNHGKGLPASDFRLSTAPAPRGTVVEDSPVFFAAWDRPTSEEVRSRVFVLTADLVVEATVPPVSVFAGDTLVYTIRVDNVSQTEAEDVAMSHSLPPGATFQTYDGCAAVPVDATRCLLGPIAGNDSRQYTLTVELADDLEDLALVLEVGASSLTRDADTTDNADTVLTALGEADVEVEIAGPTLPVTAGSSVPMMVTVRNAGPSPAVEVELSAPPTAGILAISGEGCTENSLGIPTCSFDTLLQDEEVQIELTAEIAEPAPMTVTQLVTATTVTFDPDPDDNVASVPITVLVPELTVDLDAPATAMGGEIVTLSATVTNPGNARADDVVLNWVLPPALTPLSTSGCDEVLGIPVCTVGALEPGATAPIELTVEIAPNFSDSLAVVVNAISSSLSGVTSASTETAVSTSSLSLLGGRFEVRVDWLTSETAGEGTAVPFSDNTGLFWFFGPDNFELVVKLLDGRPINDHYWFFYGALSDIEYTITVLDTESGIERTYRNDAGNLCGQADTLAFEAVESDPASLTSVVEVPKVNPWTADTNMKGGCVPEAESLCLLDGRFRVEIDWRNQHADGTEGNGTAIPGTTDSGSFWFFDDGNLDLAVKVLDGRPINDRFWFFYGGLSDVEYTIRVTDTDTGDVRSYFNPPGELCGGADIEAF